MARLIRKATTDNVQEIFDFVLTNVKRSTFIKNCKQDFSYAAQVFMEAWENGELEWDGSVPGIMIGTKNMLPKYIEQYDLQTEEYVYDEILEKSELDTSDLFYDQSKMDELMNAVSKKFGYSDLVDAIASNPYVEIR